MSPGAWLLVVIGVLAVVVTISHAWWFPNQICPHCDGTGRGKGSHRERGYNHCHWCQATPGRRVRPLTKALNKTFGMPIRAQKKGK